MMYSTVWVVSDLCCDCHPVVYGVFHNLPFVILPKMYKWPMHYMADAVGKNTADLKFCHKIWTGLPSVGKLWNVNSQYSYYDAVAYYCLHVLLVLSLVYHIFHEY
jgi:hypothetical protein